MFWGCVSGVRGPHAKLSWAADAENVWEIWAVIWTPVFRSDRRIYLVGQVLEKEIEALKTCLETFTYGWKKFLIKLIGLFSLLLICCSFMEHSAFISSVLLFVFIDFFLNLTLAMFICIYSSLLCSVDFQRPIHCIPLVTMKVIQA